MDAAQNTDRELWRETPGDYYADSLYVTEGGGIGMNVGGFVIVLPIREWHALAKEKINGLVPSVAPPAGGTVEDTPLRKSRLDDKQGQP